MTQHDDTTSTKKPLTLSGKKLTLGAGLTPKKNTGKTVVVEVKRGRKTAGAAKKDTPQTQTSRMRGMQVNLGAAKTTPTQQPSGSTTDKIEVEDRSLSNQERQSRLQALKGAMQQAEEDQRREIERLERERVAAEQAQKEKEAEEAAATAQSAADKPSDVAAPDRKAEPSKAPSRAAPRFEKGGKRGSAPEASHKKPAPQREARHFSVLDTPPAEEAPAQQTASAPRGGPVKKAPAKAKTETKRVIVRRENPRRSGKLTVTQALADGDNMRQRSLAAVKRAREKERRKMEGHEDELKQKIKRIVTVPETITVQELSNRMAERGADVIKKLMSMGVMATITQAIDADTAELVVQEFGHEIKRVSDSDIEKDLIENITSAMKDVEEESRPAVVTVMGHVDHGKTSLLDALRETDIVKGEAGGITQHIGAYQVTLEGNRKITFIDTPGHAAFTEMRARGANVTDLVILVVAADDGIKEQTIEAINHAKAANVPIIVAINKIDKPDINLDRVKNELLGQELVLEDFGGDVLSVEVSAKQRLNLDKLEEAILLQAEMLDLKAPNNCDAVGAIVEAKLEKGRGPVATVLIEKGTLKVGDVFVSGCHFGRVRAMLDDHGSKIEAAKPSTPVEIIGFDGVPQAGDTFIVVEDEAKAREIAGHRDQMRRAKIAAMQEKEKMENLFVKHGEAGRKELAVIIKSDTHGSYEALAASLQKLNTEEVSVKVVHAAVGGINESDIVLARASNALIVGFQVRANQQARSSAEAEGIEIRYYSIIYNVIDDLKAMLSGLLAPTLQENFIGKAQIRQVFKISKVGTVAGCYVTDGMVKRGSKVRLLRDDVVIHEGDLKTLRRFKDEVKEVKEGYECGMAFESYNDLKEGDVIECSEIKEVARSL